MHKKKKFGVVLAATGILMASMTQVSAHHSVGATYSNEVVEIEGEVIEFLFANPHGQIVIQDAEGAYWVGEMGNVLGLQRQGLTPDRLPAGTIIEVRARAAWEPINRVHIDVISVDGETIYGTPDA